MRKTKMRKRVAAEFNDEEIFAALELAYPDKVARLVEFYSIDLSEYLPVEVWARILGWCWKNTKTIVCVCKSWLSISRTPHYWRRAYVEKIYNNLPVDFPDWAKTYFLLQFHTFDIPECFPTFRSQVEWLFKYAKSPYNTHLFSKTQAGAFQLEIVNKDGYTITFTVYEHNAVDVAKQRGAKNVVSSYYHKSLYGIGYQRCIEAKQSNSDSIVFEEIVWLHRAADLMWRGTGQTTDLQSTSVYPEGTGAWTQYSTGEILLQGKDVAYRGHMDDGGKTYHRGKRVNRS